MKDKSSSIQLEVDNAFLLRQNEQLNKELTLARYTISALKGITNQKEVALYETRQELKKALHHIQLLKNSFKNNIQQEQEQQQTREDEDLSDDLSEEEEYLEQQRRSVDIISKLPLRPIVFQNNIYDY